MVSSFATIQELDTVDAIQLITTQTQFEASHRIVLKFSTSGNSQPDLYCANSYGSTLIPPTLNNNTLSYEIPKHISKKLGKVQWTLLNGGSPLSGQFEIQPLRQVSSLETYIGPPSIEAGGTDYTMLVVIPTDSLDNPLPENTAVTAKHQFLKSETSEVIFTEHLIAYKNMFSKRESGRMLVSSESLKHNSKEFVINVFPAIPTDFKISATRPHDYADGNQMTTFTTTIIKDKQNNIISDGTFVDFFITTPNGNVLKTSGTTVDGIATSKIIHPDHDTQWSIKSFVEGMAESNTLSISYKQVITEFNVAFSKDNRTINVGPLQSFMQQMIPDGLQVKLLVYKDGTLLETWSNTSINGFANFYLKPDVLKKDRYDIIVKTAGLTKTFNNRTLW